MKEFKGTQGEWKHSRPKGSNGFYYVGVGTGIYFTSTATCHNPLGISEDETEVRANAKLIAAAPKLLKESMKLIQQIKMNDYVESNGHNIKNNKALLDLENAINEAL